MIIRAYTKLIHPTLGVKTARLMSTFNIHNIIKKIQASNKNHRVGIENSPFHTVLLAPAWYTFRYPLPPLGCGAGEGFQGLHNKRYP